jgi:RNA polymerase sigma factor (sigma-70 family)
MECSLNALTDSGFEAVSDEAPVDEIVWSKLVSDKLYAVMAELTEDERVLIDALFFQGKSEREAAKIFGISPVAVHKRKHKTLSKLHRLLNG